MLGMKSIRSFVPTLQETRSLEAVYRLNSISAAARELNLSQPTISYHVSKLEKKWNVQLFRNKGRQIESTEFLRSVISEIISVAHQLDHIGYLVGSQERKKELCIGMTSSLASIVLLPRLVKFQALYPNLNIRIQTSNRFENLEKERIDVTLRLLQRPAGTCTKIDDSFTIPIVNERIRLVCSPAYLATLSRAGEVVRSAEILSQAQLIHEDETMHWAQYLSTFHPSLRLRKRPVLTLNNSDLILQTAVSGGGFALLRETYIMDALGKGALVEPFQHRLDCERVFHFVAPEGTGLVAAAQDFVLWFSNELKGLV